MRHGQLEGAVDASGKRHNQGIQILYILNQIIFLGPGLILVKHILLPLTTIKASSAVLPSIAPLCGVLITKRFTAYGIKFMV